MKILLSRIWDALRGSLWFLPACMLMAAYVMAMLLTELDASLAEQIDRSYPWFYQGGPEGARALLTTVAGSMISVAGVTFSITIVALTLASSQFGPRLLRNFMRDRYNQFVLGTFTATFLYSLIVLQDIQGPGAIEFVPRLAVQAGLALAIVNLVILIYFIHHVSFSIQADVVIAAVCAEFDAVINALLPQECDETSNSADEPCVPKETLEQFEREGVPVAAVTNGYVQAIGLDALKSWATDHDLVVQVNARPGDFVIAGSAVIFVIPKERLPNDFEKHAVNAIALGRQRTIIQDIEFAIDQLVEIAVRALSPGVNDPFTAMRCIDQLGARLAHLGRRRFPARCHCDESGELRVIADTVTFQGTLDASFNQIRQFGRENVAVLIRMLETFHGLAQLLPGQDQREGILRHARMVAAAAREAVPEEHDRDDIEKRFRAVEDLCSAAADVE